MHAFTTTPVARQQYDCSERPGCIIKAGDRHVREAWPPWTLVQDDPDVRPMPVGGWWVRRFHSACQIDQHYTPY